MAAADEHSKADISRKRLRDLVSRWTGTRTFIVSAAIVFLVLVLFDGVHPIAAFVSFLFLAGVAVSRWIAVGETTPIRIGSDTGDSRLPAFASGGTALALLNRLPDPLIVLDGTGRVLFANVAAEALVGTASTGRHVATVLRSAPLVTAIDGVIADGKARSIEYTVPVPVQRNYTAMVSVIADTGTPSPSSSKTIFMLLRDITEARRIEAMRADFVAFASHELKTPLASLSGFIDTLRGHAKDDPEARDKFLGIMSDQATRMRHLIDDLLSLSRIELREHVRPSDAVDLFSVVNDIADGLTPLSERYEVEIGIHAPAGLPLVRGDREELGQVIQNLAENALRYGRTGKRIEISLAPDQKGGRPYVRLTVRDFGPGIAKEHIPRLTERFYRVDPAASRAKGGTGLGLAIVKHIVNRHEGTLTIESELGQGSVFSVLLPIFAAPAAAK
ncbi:multi-sensor signal transduction histidine kinase [Parvibaculum lavamentivorans DS-1]|uniref:histidine kinase n=1 Tax=Parvibaculum lavamentivorans (strain DS-1 / DSM 13023 / NCIMB 13966) TaxID=402881 RepID=A7HQ33_PARL1|nr:ATP-binding protein [Parvibaculum lavamentivorans]ABS62016.1 multi-sensor signal transduction histidine kinase [Parvibaculum lavamentivorans DS-1]